MEKITIGPKSIPVSNSPTDKTGAEEEGRSDLRIKRKDGIRGRHQPWKHGKNPLCMYMIPATFVYRKGKIYT